MDRYDYVIAGGGAAGLGLAYQLARSALGDRRILIIDRERKMKNDRTWCFWTDRDTPFDHIVYKKWDKFLFNGPGGDREIDLSPYQYRMIRGLDFYEHTLGILEGRPGVDFVYGNVESVQDGPDYATVTVDGAVYRGSWVFDSLFLPHEFTVDTERYHFLKQHFKGYFIETERPVFRPDAVTLFDFRTPQEGSMRFMYILPFSSQRALVEYTLFSATLLPAEEYDRRLKEYLEQVLGLTSYRIEEEEEGVIPMTDQPFARAGGKRVMYTGTKGGMVKASTGFAFLRTQRDCEAIVESLIATGQPFHNRRPPRRYHTFDAMLLQILHRHGGIAADVFSDLFLKNPIQRMFRFLDEEDGIRENLKVMASVPWWPFIRAWLKLRILRRV